MRAGFFQFGIFGLFFGILQRDVFTYGKLTAQLGVQRAGNLTFLLRKYTAS